MFRTGILVGLICSAAAVLSAEPADLVVVNAKIVSLTGGKIAEAMAVKDDRMIAVGSNDQIKMLTVPATKQIAAAGKCVIPGLIDSHVHPAGAAMYEFDHPIPEMDTVADVLKHIAQRAEQLKEGEWILMSQVFITRLR